ncbi:restriction endonuclease subunit S [Vibrio rotiferianus]|uniref:restriction endonuclease subunit S n=1 Tax=Vibrio rotiferianus TaxID=190895 RepID=UPI00397FD736
MGSEITYRKLKDCAVWYSGGTPRKSNAEYWNGTIPWISAKSLHDTFICDSEDKVTELGAQNGTRTVPEGTILFVVRGMSLKNEFRVGLTTDTVTFNQDLKALLPVEGIDSHYLLYFLKSKAKDILSLVEEAGHGTGVLPTAVLQELDVPVPPLQQQKLVAKVILNFDEKIKINRQINQTLETMAQTLFKSWFVDYDPVIDNALDTGSSIPEVFEARVERRKAVRESADFKPLPDDVRQLFPSEFEESELGWVPKGWGTCAVKSHCVRVQNGGTPKRSEASYWENGNIPWLTSGEVRQTIVTEVSSVITQKGLEESSAKWVEKLSTLVALYGATAGEVSINADKLTTNQAVCALMPQEFYCWFNYLQVKRKTSEMQSKAVGSAQQNISKGLVESLVVVSPTHAAVKCFHDIAEGCFKRMIKNQHESRTLEKLRDTLLPKLISGELRLDSSEVEQAKALVD